MGRVPVSQLTLPFDSVEDAFLRAFQEIHPRVPPPELDIRFYPYANLDSKIRLEAGHRRIRARLSDQLEHAPASVQEALAHVLLSKLYRRPVSSVREQVYRTFINRAEVRRRALEVRRSRGRKLLKPPEGGCYNLDSIFDDLNRRFFEGSMRKPRLGWSVRASRRLLGHYDPAHDAIVISRVFDTPEMPQFVLEYVVYHEMLHLKHPVLYGGARRCVHSAAFKADERRFPRFAEASFHLQRL
jgi:hypothetical protein